MGHFKNSFWMVAVLWAASALFNAAYASSANICRQLQQNLDQFQSDNNITGMSLYVSTSDNSSCYLFSASIKKEDNQQIAQNNLWQIGSIRNNPVPFSDFAKTVLHVVLD